MSQLKSRPMEPSDIFRIKFVTDPRLSPDARQLAFVVTTLSEEDDEYRSNIWVVDVSGGEARRFTTGPKRDTAPRWSPDGRRIAFISDRESKKKPQLYVMPADGGEPSRLTDLPTGAGSPTWSPDSTRLTVVSRVGGPAEPETDEEKAKSRPAQVISTLKYRLDGEGYVHQSVLHVFVIDVSGGEPRQISDGPFADADPAWSPDGKLVAFASARHPGRDTDDASDIWIVDASGGEPRKVTDTSGPVGSPVFSPDGVRIAYVGSRYVNEAGRNARIFSVPAAGGEQLCLSASLDRNGGKASWTRSGHVIFTAEDRGDVRAYRIDAEQPGRVEPILSGRRQIADLSISADGTLLAYTSTDPTSPAEVFVSASNGGGERQVTDLNRDWKAEVARSEPVHFVFERDGFEIDGWIVRPAGFEAGKRYPLLLNIHGGPETQYGTTFFDEFQVYAGAGYVVLYVNPRGSQGHGEEFTRAMVGDWGGGDYADVMAGLDEALRRYDFIDPSRLGVMGGSYGGYLTSWIVSHCDRFKAACSERAVNYFLSLFGTSAFGPSFSAYAGGLPWDKPTWYADHSPFTHAAKINTPLLIIHSEQDLNCPIEQAEQLFVTLKVLGKETLFIRFPDENHELSRSGRPRHRLERFRHILEWFGKYLGPTG